MIHQLIPPSNKSIWFSREIACALAAASLAVLSIMAFWSFELRSFLKLISWGFALFITCFVVLFLVFFRKLPAGIEIEFTFIAGALVGSLVFILLALQPHPSDPRALASAGMVFFAFLFFCGFLIYPVHFFMGISPLKQIFFFSALMLGFFGIGILLINGLSVRMYGDDFCYVLQRISIGWIRASLNFYRIWSARFSSNFLLMGLSDKHWAPLAQILAILCSFFLALKRWLYRAEPNGWPAVIAAALFIPFAAFSVTPDLYKSVYWIVSSVTVLPLLVLIPLYFFALASVLQSEWGKPLAISLGAFASFLIPTIHEVAALGWFFCTLIMLSSFSLQKKEWRRMKIFLTITALSAGAGLAVLLLSPGVAARSLAQDYPPPPSLPEILLISFQSFINFLRNLTLPYYAYQQGRQPAWLIAVSLAGLGWFSPVAWTRRWRVALIFLVTSVIMAYLSFIPGAYATSGSIPLRSQLIPVTYLSIGVYCAALFIPRWSDNRWSSIFIGLAFACLVLGSFKSISQLSLTIQPMRQYARDWDARHSASQIKPGAITRIHIPWEESEQEFVCVRDYYLTLFPDSD